MHGEWLTEDRPDPATRVERSVGILEDHLDVATYRAHPLTSELGDVLALEEDLTRRRWLKGRHQTRERRLAASALPDETERLALADLRLTPSTACTTDLLRRRDTTFHREVLHDLPDVQKARHPLIRRRASIRSWSRGLQVSGHNLLGYAQPGRRQYACRNVAG